MFEKEIEEYERVRNEYQQKMADKMGRQQWMEYNVSLSPSGQIEHFLQAERNISINYGAVF